MKHGNRPGRAALLAQRKTKMERLTWITLVTIVWEEGESFRSMNRLKEFQEGPAVANAAKRDAE